MAKKHGFGFPIYLLTTLALSGYFAFAAIQGDLGVVKRIEATAEYDRLSLERDRLMAEVEVLSNKTRRLSDQFLDLDLLDERARNVLGHMRADEVAIQ